MEFLGIAITCVKKASKVLIDNFEKENILKKKSDNSYVTDVDLQSEKIIINIIQKKSQIIPLCLRRKALLTKNQNICGVLILLMAHTII